MQQSWNISYSDFQNLKKHFETLLHIAFLTKVQKSLQNTVETTLLFGLVYSSEQKILKLNTPPPPILHLY